MTTSNVGGTAARRVLRNARTASLATLEDNGAPYASLVNVATDLAGLPVIFASRLARHTRNLTRDARASLLAGDLPAEGDALTGSRVSVLGRFEPMAREDVAARYLAHHPAAQGYIGFADFTFWRLEAREVHTIAGFGRIETLPADQVFPAVDPGFAALAASAIDHLNADHAEALNLIATRLLGGEAGTWRAAAIDPDGYHLVSSSISRRGNFEQPVETPAALRPAFAKITASVKM